MQTILALGPHKVQGQLMHQVDILQVTLVSVWHYVHTYVDQEMKRNVVRYGNTVTP